MSFFVFKARQSLALFIYASLFLFSSSTLAGSMTVYPLRVTFEANKTSEIVTVRNSDTKTLLLQTSIMKWSQVNGEEVLEPTRDVLLAPPLVEVPPGESQTVRLVLRREADATTQASYRLVLQELPKPGATATTQLAMALRITLPVFVSPKAPAQAQLVASHVNGSTLVFRNSGNAHIQVKKLALTSAGTTIVKSESMFYVLPGQTIKVPIDTKGRSLNGTERLELSTDAGDMVLNLTSM